MDSIVNFIEYLFSSKRTLIYTTFTQKDYYKIVSMLKSASIKYRVAVSSNQSCNPGGPYSNLGTIYKIYVKKADKHKAQSILS